MPCDIARRRLVADLPGGDILMPPASACLYGEEFAVTFSNTGASERLPIRAIGFEHTLVMIEFR